MNQICVGVIELKGKNSRNLLQLKMKLDPLLEPPEPLKELMKGDAEETKHFLSNARKENDPFCKYYNMKYSCYNSCFQITSFWANITREACLMPTFRVQGQVYHTVGSLLPLPHEDPKFFQIYLMGDEQQETSISPLFPNSRNWT